MLEHQLFLSQSAPLVGLNWQTLNVQPLKTRRQKNARLCQSKHLACPNLTNALQRLQVGWMNNDTNILDTGFHVRTF